MHWGHCANTISCWLVYHHLGRTQKACRRGKNKNKTEPASRASHYQPKMYTVWYFNLAEKHRLPMEKSLKNHHRSVDTMAKFSRTPGEITREYVAPSFPGWKEEFHHLHGYLHMCCFLGHPKILRCWFHKGLCAIDELNLNLSHKPYDSTVKLG